MRCALAGLVLFGGIVTSGSLHAGQAGTVDLYVAPAGNDQADGAADRPVATLRKAVELQRAVKADRPKRIIVRGGRYYDVSITLTPEDSGLTIEAAAGEKPLLFGGVQLKEWKRDGERFVYAEIPDLKSQISDTAPGIRLLRVNGRLCPRARLPQAGTFAHLTSFDVPWMSSTGGGWKRKPTTQELTTLKYKDNDLGPWLDVRSAEITVYHMWDESVVGVASADHEQKVLTLFPETGHPPGAFGVKKYAVWNVREGMTAPGQWYHDRKAGRIVYWPLPGEDIASLDAVIPTTASIVRLKGTDAAPIRNVTLRGLSLSVTNVPLVAGGFAAAQLDGAVSLDRAENCLLDGLDISIVAGHAINTHRACAGTRVEGCDVSECGAGGIYVGGTKALINNNHVHGVGRSFPSAIGIFRGGKQNVVSHNEVHDCTYSAINYGGDENIVEDNLIYDCMKVLHDGAAIYMFAAKGCILRRNLARDITDTGGYGASAYYLDERSEDCIVERNLSVNVRWPSHNHMALKNTIRNNVFIVTGDAKMTFPRSSNYTVEGNVLHATGKIRIEGIDAVTSWSRNVFYSAAGKIEGVKLKDYSAAGTGEGVRGDTVVADLMFEDMAKGDYRYKAGSPALKLGLEAIDVSKAGRLRAQP